LNRHSSFRIGNFRRLTAFGAVLQLPTCGW